MSNSQNERTLGDLLTDVEYALDFDDPDEFRHAVAKLLKRIVERLSVPTEAVEVTKESECGVDNE